MTPYPGSFPAIAAETPAAGGDPGFDWASVDLPALGLAVLCLFLAGLMAALRRALVETSSSRVLACASPDRRASLERLLGRVEPLAASASILEVLSRLFFVACVLRVTALGEPLRWGRVVLTIAGCGPVLWFTTEALARAVALRHGARLLLRGLPLFAVAQLPVGALGVLLTQVRRSMLRLLNIGTDPDATREIVAGLREVLADRDVTGMLDETERRVIGNVMALREVDVAAVMTPRTQVRALDVAAGIDAAVALAAESAHSVLPVYEGSLDKVVGTVSARDLVQALAKAPKDRPPLRSLLHQAYFVPEAKPAAELLADMRRHKTKLAIVIDEYGGTAGLVTIGDILGELVGEIRDEYDEDAPAPLRRMGADVAEVDATLHVSEVNEALDLEIPEEEDFETLGGYVLAELGHLPAQGERFVRGGAEFSVLEASDRRVLKVRVKKLAGTAAG